MKEIVKVTFPKRIKIGLFGGSFDPITNAHLIVAETAREQFKLDYVHFIPTYQNPLKDKKVTKDYHRQAMLELALEDNCYFLQMPCDIERKIVNTIDTINFYTNPGFMKDCELYFIMGSDCLHTFTQWKDWKKILENVTILVGDRESDDDWNLDITNYISNGYKRLAFKKIKPFKIPFTGISSTDVRNRIKAGKSIKYLVPESVEKYIYDNELYNQR